MTRLRIRLNYLDRAVEIKIEDARGDDLRDKMARKVPQTPEI
jgi:hypothetical protein